jgi:hypothetical protein
MCRSYLLYLWIIPVGCILVTESRYIHKLFPRLVATSSVTLVFSFVYQHEALTGFRGRLQRLTFRHRHFSPGFTALGTNDTVLPGYRGFLAWLIGWSFGFAHLHHLL